MDLDWYTTREREYAEVLPWDHLDAGLDREWLWEDWQDALDEVEVDDCRWTPCFECGVCPQLDTTIQIGPTGRRLLPLTPVADLSNGSLNSHHWRARNGRNAVGRFLRLRLATAKSSAMARSAVVVLGSALATPRTQPEQHPPPVQWLRVKYAKRGRARFTSHRDFGRAFERALRRAGVPMAYSSGFSPHPRISYPNASPTGAASEAEYLEIGLAAACDPDKVRVALDAALPPGLDVVEVAVVRPGALAEELTGSRWQVDLAGSAESNAAGCPRGVPRQGRGAGAADDQERNAGVRRPCGRGQRSRSRDGRLTMTLAHQTPLVRPDDVLAGLRVASPEFAPMEPPILTRLAQGRLDPESGAITEPGHLQIAGGAARRASQL